MAKSPKCYAKRLSRTTDKLGEPSVVQPDKVYWTYPKKYKGNSLLEKRLGNLPKDEDFM